VLRAGAALASRIDLAAVTDVAADPADVLVVDALHLVDAERADLAARAAHAGRSTEGAAPSTIAIAIAGAALARAVRRTRGCRAVRSLLGHHSLLEGDLVGIELLALGGACRGLGTVAGGRARPIRPRIEHLEVVRADVEAHPLPALAVR